jgi:dipeptidyl aminopeptidase/acylaminoacyl peptidase
MKQFLSVLVLSALHGSWAGAQSGDVPIPASLVGEGVPRIPAVLAGSVSRYTDFRSALLHDWHPTKREMLIGTRFGDTNQVHEVRFPGGARTQLTFYADPAVAQSYQPKTGDYFLFNMASGGNEFYQIYRFDLTTGQVTLLTDGASRNTGGVWSHAGDRFIYGSTRRTGKDVDLWVMDPLHPDQQRLAAPLSGGGWAALDWSPDDQQVLAAEYLSINESYLWLVDAASGGKTPLTRRSDKEKIAYRDARFSKDGRGLYVTTDLDSEFLRLAYFDLTTKQCRFLTSSIPWDVEAFDLSSDGSRIGFVTNEEGIGTLHLLDTASGKELAKPKLPPGSVHGVRWHKNGRDLGFTLDSARAPVDVYSLDVESGKIEQWTASETGGIVTAGFAEPELIHWQSFDKRAISGYFYGPPLRFTGKRPVIVQIHGGPESQFRPRFLGRDNYYLNELGIALIFPNIRGSSGYGKSFLQLDNGYRREDAYRDIGALLEWIRTRPELDADRVMVTGGSYGGHMTLVSATRYNDLVRCAVDVVGMSSLVTFLEHTEGYRRDLRRVEYGDERDPSMRTFLEKIAPLNHAGQIKKPLFVIQGYNDPRVPRAESEQMVATVRKNGAAVWYLLAKDEGHGFAKKQNADYQFYATVLFVKEFLLK